MFVKCEIFVVNASKLCSKPLIILINALVKNTYLTIRRGINIINQTHLKILMHVKLSLNSTRQF